MQCATASSILNIHTLNIQIQLERATQRNNGRQPREVASYIPKRFNPCQRCRTILKWIYTIPLSFLIVEEVSRAFFESFLRTRTLRWLRKKMHLSFSIPLEVHINLKFISTLLFGAIWCYGGDVETKWISFWEILEFCTEIEVVYYIRCWRAAGGGCIL